MKLRITETAWGINRKTGDRSEKVTADVKVPCEVGDIPEFGKGRRRFCIDEVSGDGITLSVHCADPRYDRTWTIKIGETVSFRPRSFDGGYYYEFRII